MRATNFLLLAIIALQLAKFNEDAARPRVKLVTAFLLIIAALCIVASAVHPWK